MRAVLLLLVAAACQAAPVKGEKVVMEAAPAIIEEVVDAKMAATEPLLTKATPKMVPAMVPAKSSTVLSTEERHAMKDALIKATQAPALDAKVENFIVEKASSKVSADVREAVSSVASKAVKVALKERAEMAADIKNRRLDAKLPTFGEFVTKKIVQDVSKEVSPEAAMAIKSLVNDLPGKVPMPSKVSMPSSKIPMPSTKGVAEVERVATKLAATVVTKGLSDVERHAAKAALQAKVVEKVEDELPSTKEERRVIKEALMKN